MAPHFTSELWSLFIRVPNRINQCSNEISWDRDVLEQSWPKIDAHYALELKFMVRYCQAFAIIEISNDLIFRSGEWIPKRSASVYRG